MYSSTLINTWALAVQPGSPAQPSPKSPDLDLTSLGYTSVFVHLPHTPRTPPPPHKSIKKTKSMGMLKSKPKSKPHPPLPPTLQNELLLMQFTGGGSLQSNAQHLMNQRAANGPVDTVHKDSHGILWLDEAEKLEYRPLLSPSTATTSSTPHTPSRWVQFTLVHPTPPPHSPTSVKSMSPTERELDSGALLTPLTPTAYLPVVRPRKQYKKRPAPLKLHSAPTVPTARISASPFPSSRFDDSFQPVPTSLALAAGVLVYSRHAQKKVNLKGLGRRSAPADVVKFSRAALPPVPVPPLPKDKEVEVAVELPTPQTREPELRKLSMAMKKRGGFTKRAKAFFGM
ncbi:hypothetical protein VNI00_008282 [Paramarasmius palmivorus]|uniref:Uncharacterized protein n=1 Tax=Paramarasmius palmivorus TaxID=297713 RepID=A0AAW0CYQ8_9AGAR